MTNVRSAKPADQESLDERCPPMLARAEQLRQKGEHGEALRMVTLFLNDNFDHVPALALAAMIYLEGDTPGMAQPLLAHAARLKPDAGSIWGNLALCYQEGQDRAVAEGYYFRALKLNPKDANAHSNLGMLYGVMGQPHKAMRHLDRAIEIDPSIADAYYNRAMANISLGKWREGWPEYDSILGNGDIRKERIFGMIPRWNGTEGKQLIAYGEQGIGDEIAFASCIPELIRNNKVVLETNPKLRNLFRRSFGLETHGTRLLKGVALPWLVEDGKMRKFDGAVALGSLPQFYRLSDESIPGTPYLIPDPERRLQWKSLLQAISPNKLKVGIAWTGGNPNTGKARRSVQLPDLLPILRQDATFVSLQYMDSPEIVDMQKDHGIKIHHWRHATQTEDYDDTAALIAELDLVISVCTANIHLSGAIGQNCWVMTPKEPRWFYGIAGDKMPWYNSVKLYRQKTDWVHVIAQIGTDLRNLINQPRVVT